MCPVTYLRTIHTGWRDGSVAKSESSFRRARFSSQNPHRAAHHLLLTPAPGDLVPSSGLCGHCTHMHTSPHTHNLEVLAGSWWHMHLGSRGRWISEASHLHGKFQDNQSYMVRLCLTKTKTTIIQKSKKPESGGVCLGRQGQVDLCEVEASLVYTEWPDLHRETMPPPPKKKIKGIIHIKLHVSYM